MFTVAITGGIGCGKSEAARIFAELGVTIIDLDVISHQLTEANQPLVSTIANSFGYEYVTADGALDRAAMRQLIFNNEAARKKLNAILHPAIYDEAIRQLHAHANEPYAILAIPLLYEDSPFLPHIDRILVIDCDETIQIERVKKRSSLSESEALQIIHAQAPREERLKLADDVVENNKNIANLRQKIVNLHQKYIKTCIVRKTIS